VCRAPYTGEYGIFRVGNSAHSLTCRHHSTRLPNFVDPDVEASDDEDSNDEDSDDEVVEAAIRMAERIDSGIP
jgi:hypothetical protein